MMEGARDYMVERRSTEEFEAARQEAERVSAEIERLFLRSSRSSLRAISDGMRSRRPWNCRQDANSHSQTRCGGVKPSSTDWLALIDV